MTEFFLVSYILSILFILTSIGWLVVCGSRNKTTYAFIIMELLLFVWLMSQLILVFAASDFQRSAGRFMCASVTCVIGSVWLYFALCFAKCKISPLIYGIIICVPLLHLVLLSTNGIHFMFYQADNFTGRGVFFVTNFVYTHLAMVSGLLVIWHSSLKHKLYRKTLSLLLTLAVATPLLLNLVYVFSLIRSEMDLTPVAFTFSSVIVLISLKNYGFLNINGMALEKIIGEIGQGVIVYNMNGSISYQNRLGEEYATFIENSPEDEWEISHNGNIYSVKKLVHYNSLNTPVAYTLVISDVTRYYEYIRKNNELNAANASLRSERERNIIAGQLHDTIGHTLTKINTLAKISKIEGKDYSSQIEEIATDGITELRETVNTMKKSKPLLMTDALKALTKTEGISINLTVQGEDGTKYMPLTDTVYRSAKEAITNTLRYGKAQNMDIIVRFKADFIEVFIFDDGVGCNEIKQGNGLKGIEERVKAVHGTVSFSSVESEGFCIKIKLPLEV